MPGSLRHAGILVKSIRASAKTYLALGFEPIAPIEHLRVLKMADKQGQVIELVQGNWHPHVAVNWYADEDGNYVEVVNAIENRE